MRLALLLTGLLALSAVTVETYAQQPLSSHLGYHQEHFGNMPWPHYCHGGYGTYHHASTYEEGVLRGYADLVRSQGAFNFATSLARVKNEEARRLAIQNKKEAVETYFELKQINRDARESNYQRPSAEDIARFARDRAPEPLSASDINPVTGRPHWPTALMHDVFRAERTSIEASLATRRKTGDASDVQLRMSAERLENHLKQEISRFNPSEYLAAKKFVTGLKYTETLPSADARLVVR